MISSRTRENSEAFSKTNQRPSSSPLHSWVREPGMLPLALTAGIATLWLLYLCLMPQARWVDFLSDDAYYYLKVARNIALGNGPTFDGVTVTTGFHPLFAFILAGFQNLLPHSSTALPRAMLFFNSACFLLTGWLIRSALKNQFEPKTANWGTAFWFANPSSLLLVSSGMEGSLYACLIAAWFAVFTWIPASSNATFGLKTFLALAVINGLAVITRTDALVLLVLGAAAIGAPPILRRIESTFSPASQPMPPTESIGKNLLKSALYLIVALIPFALWLAYAEHHTGTWFQASAKMKELWREEATQGLSVTGELFYSLELFRKWIVKSILKVPALKFLLPFTGVCFCLIRFKPLRFTFGYRQILWLFPLLLGAAYSLKFTKAWTWYYAPGLVTLTLLAAGALHRAETYRQQNRLKTLIQQGLPWIMLFVLAESYTYLGLKTVRGRNRGQRDMYATATWIQENLPEDAWLSAWNSGVYGWVGERTLTNLDGLINNEIYQNNLDGYSEEAYIRRRGIEYIVDRNNYMARSLPDWEENIDYSLVYRHNSVTGSKPIEIWKVLR